MMVWDLIGEDTNEHGLPPGFRFHPSDEELITFYLASKVYNGNSFGGVQIVEVDLNRCEPWELPDVAKMGEREWYFYSLKDRKYPTGLRTNRATGAGYWKATGKDREVYSSSNGGSLVGMKKTLVFYKGRAPRGEKTKWVLHEYRLDGEFSNRHACKEWVICRIFHKAGCEKKNPFPLNHGFFVKRSFSTSIPFLPSLMNMHVTPPNMQTLLQNNDCFINNQLPRPPLPLPPPPTTTCSSSSSSANITSLLNSHQNHTPISEMIPVTKQSNIQTIEEGEGEDGILNWLDYCNQQNPFVIDLGLFNSCLSNACSSSNAVHDMSFPFPNMGESQPLISTGQKVNGMGMSMAYL